MKLTFQKWLRIFFPVATLIALPFSSVRASNPQEMAALKRHIHLEGSRPANIGDWLTSLSEELLSLDDHCLKEESDRAATRCYHDQLFNLLVDAEKAGISDSIIREGIKNQFSSLQIKNGKFTLVFHIQKPPKNEKRARRKMIRKLKRFARRGLAPLPSLHTYLVTQESFRDLRKNNGADEDLSPEVSKKLMKLYPRKVEKAGKVPLEASMMARFTRGQIKDLADLTLQGYAMLTALSVKVVYLRDDYRKLLEEIEWLEMEVNEQIERLNLIDVTLPENEKTVDAVQASLIAKQDELDQKRAELAASSSEEALRTSQAERETLIRDLAAAQDPLLIEDLQDQITELDQRIQAQKTAHAKERIEIQLSTGDADRLTLNFLKAQIETMSLSPAYANRELEIGDIVGAVFLRGDLNSKAIDSILVNSEILEPHASGWKKVGGIALSMAQMALMTNAATAPFVTIGTIIWNATKSVRDMKQNTAKRIQYVH